MKFEVIANFRNKRKLNTSQISDKSVRFRIPVIYYKIQNCVKSTVMAETYRVDGADCVDCQPNLNSSFYGLT